MFKYLKQIIVNAFSIIVAVIFSILIISLLLVFTSKTTKVADNTILKITLKGKIIERSPTVTPLQLLSNDRPKQINIWELKNAIKKAQTDHLIKGIYIEFGMLSAGWAQLTELRQALLEFKKSGKFVIAYGEGYTHKTYYLATAATEIVLNPEGHFLFKGLSITIPFFRSMLEKLDVKPQIFRVGEYKSAVEPFLCYEMSAESKHQTSVLLNSIYDLFIDTIAETRNTTSACLREMANTLSVTIPQEVHEAKLVSHLGYYNDVETIIKSKINLEATESISYVNFDDYSDINNDKSSKKNKIAVLIAEGDIVDGKSGEANIGSQDFARAIRKLKKDKSIKAVVLRINSPGGSALASDVLWKELSLLKEEKPVVASMSNIAASGGYYLAVACNHIIAHPNTITGSIGVFGLFFDVHALLKNKLGVTTDTVKTSKYADSLENIGRPLDEYERAVVQKNVEKTYDTFITKVAQGRKLTKQEVHKIACGRVWPGNIAKEKGLVDELGGLEEAINSAAKLANIDPITCKVIYWPKQEGFLDRIINNFKDIESKSFLEKVEMLFPELFYMQTISNMHGIQTRVPYDIYIE